MGRKLVNYSYEEGNGLLYQRTALDKIFNSINKTREPTIHFRDLYRNTHPLIAISPLASNARGRNPLPCPAFQRPPPSYGSLNLTKPPSTPSAHHQLPQYIRTTMISLQRVTAISLFLLPAFLSLPSRTAAAPLPTLDLFGNNSCTAPPQRKEWYHPSIHLSSLH